MPDMDANEYTIKLGGMTAWKKGKEIFDFPSMTFSDVNYVAVVAMQQLRRDEMNKLADVGLARVSAAGKLDELRAFGVDVPVSLAEMRTPPSGVEVDGGQHVIRCTAKGGLADLGGIDARVPLVRRPMKKPPDPPG
ncbi:hypothetical protein LCGC14_1538060 [marine sediment metagenome]|uniref:Uncharacterized protein n=1 Tax=marine sediment metagenome TaxID=412755 RepID=A0A0F9ITZ3_9ZZZZ